MACNTETLYIYAWMCALLAPERMDGLCSYSASSHTSVTGECNNEATEIGSLTRDQPRETEWRFSRKRL